MTPAWHYRHWHLLPALLAALAAIAVAAAGLLFNALFVASLVGATGAVLWRLYLLLRLRLVLPFTRGWLRSALPWQALNRTLLWALVAASVHPALVPEELGEEYTTAVLLNVAACGTIILLAWTGGPRVLVVRNVLSAVGSLYLSFCLWRYQSPPKDAFALAMPLDAGEWLVVHGGRSPITNGHYALRGQRDALDLIRVDAAAPAEGRRPEEYPAFGTGLVAPADGVVADAVDGHPDQPIGGSDPDSPAGNYVSIEIAPGRFVLLAHAQRGSLLVKPGDVVKRGQPIARVGNSGNTTEPHLHIQVQNKPQLSYARDARTYPMVFEAEVRYRGQPQWTSEGAADLRRGDRLRPTRVLQAVFAVIRNA